MSDANASNGIIKFESGTTQSADYELMSDSGDQTIYTMSGVPIFSGKAGFAPTVRPNGIVSVVGGGNILSPHATNDTLTVAGGTCYISGSLVTWSATTVTITRGGVGTEYIKNSVVVNGSGTVSVVNSDGHATAFSTTRGADGGPPSIPLQSVELGQVHTDSDTAAAIESDEIKQNVNQGYSEWSNTLYWNINNIGIGLKSAMPGSNTAYKNAYVEFAAARPYIHGATANAASTATGEVYLLYAEPIISPCGAARDWTGAENAISVATETYYQVSLGSTSTALSAGSFVYGVDGNPITDPLLKQKGQFLTFMCYPDANSLPYEITQGDMSAATTYVAEGRYSSAITIGARVATAGFDGN